MLGTAKANALCAKLTSLLRIVRGICIGAYCHGSVLISPCHDTSELTCDGCLYSRDCSVIYTAGRTVEGDHIALMVLFTSQGEFLVFLIHDDVATAGYTASAHTTCNYCCVGGHTTTYS